MTKRRILVRMATAMLAALSLSTTANGQQASIQNAYSATAVHSMPGQPETRGTVIKSGENMRLEFDQNGEPVIQILRPEIGVMYVLNPKTETYYELSGVEVPNTSSQNSVAPCTDQSGLAVCQQVGVDTISGIQVERWLMASQPDTQPLVILWDPTRRHALRQDYPDGSSNALSFVAMEDVSGRRTEHWSRNILAPGQEPLTGGWWFDPEIRVVVREELPGGEVRQLTNIVVGAVDPTLFQPPAGWNKQDTSAIETPQAPALASE